MTSTPAHPSRVNPAIKYQEFVSKMFERFRHDDGRDIEEWSEVEVPPAFDFIRFRTEAELKFFDPSKPEFWNRKVCDDFRQTKRTQSPTPCLPPDPLSDENFKRIQQRVCNKPSHLSLLEQSIQRCELPDEELEKGAEDIPTIEDSEDLKREIKNLCRAFENHCNGDSDVSEGDEDFGEDEAVALRGNTRNILEDLNQSVASEETAEISGMLGFQPRKSSTFLIPAMEESRTDGEESVDENPDTIIETAGTADLEQCDKLEEDSSSFLRIRVTCEESDSNSSHGTESSVSTSESDRTLLSVPTARASTHPVSGSSVTPKKQHPPLHLLTPLQRRLVKLDLY